MAVAKTGELYDRDFVLWTQQQAAPLRRAKSSDLPLDWDNLAAAIGFQIGSADQTGLGSP
jgi:hypothetical protein